MFELSKTELELLEKIGHSGNGRELIHLLKKIRADIDKTTNIPDNSDYGAEVKGRALTTKILNKLLSGMEKNKIKSPTDTEDLDNWD